MTNLLEQAPREVERLPEAERDAVVDAMLDYVKQMRDIQSTDARVAEVRHRVADSDRELVSYAEVRARGSA